MRPKVTVVFAGRRDNYEVPRALADAGWDVLLVTDLYARPWLAKKAKWFRRFRIFDRLARRAPSETHFETQTSLPLMLSFLYHRLARRLTPTAQAERLGHLAGKVAAQRGGVFICYSTYAYSAFPISRSAGVQGILFQMHPHAATCVRVLEAITGEIRGVHKNIEWEYRLNEEQYRRFKDEWQLADRMIAASTFTKESLIAAGAEREKIDVVPYGIPVLTSPIKSGATSKDRPVALFVGSFVRRKGALDFAALARRLGAEWRFVAVGRGLFEEIVMRAFREAAVEVLVNASEADLARCRTDADLLLFPSYLEGFGFVITEAMGAGLPVLTTSHTCGPDLIRNGIEGYIFKPGDLDGFEKALRELVADRSRLAAMSSAARSRSREWTWARFRAGIVECVERLL